MNPALKRAYGLLHFPLFLIVLVSSQLFLARGDAAIEAQIAALPVTSLEQGVLQVLFRLGNFGLDGSTLIAAVAIGFFTIASINRRQFIVNQALYTFFLYFFTTYFFMRMAPGMIAILSPLLGTSMFMACVLVAVFSGGPALIVRKIHAVNEKKRQMNVTVAVTFEECSACGAKFLSNPSYCSRCLSKLS